MLFFLLKMAKIRTALELELIAQLLIEYGTFYDSVGTVTCCFRKFLYLETSPWINPLDKTEQVQDQLQVAITVYFVFEDCAISCCIILTDPHLLQILPDLV